MYIQSERMAFPHGALYGLGWPSLYVAYMNVIRPRYKSHDRQTSDIGFMWRLYFSTLGRVIYETPPKYETYS